MLRLAQSRIVSRVQAGTTFLRNSSLPVEEEIPQGRPNSAYEILLRGGIALTKTILVVDDEASIRELLDFSLRREGYEVILAQDGPGALAALNSAKIDLVILDLMLPEIDGLEVCKTIRRSSMVPIIMLTARDTELDKVVGLELGADDYVTKPFSPRELVSRVKAVLRRADLPKPSDAVISDGQLQILVDRHEVYLSGKQVYLTPKEFELLVTLAQSPGRVFTRDYLLDKVWGYDFAGGTRTVDVHVRRLRQKLGESRIATVHGVGYKFEPVERG